MKLTKIFMAIAAVFVLIFGASASAEVLTAIDSEPLTKQPELRQMTDTPDAPRPTRRSVADYADRAEGNYTGLIVDCRGLNLRTAMNPVIFNTNGTKIFGHKNIDPDKAAAQGMVDYVSHVDNATRAGEHPLIVKAVRLEKFNTSPVISIADSNRVLIENYATKFLNELKVVFLID